MSTEKERTFLLTSIKDWILSLSADSTLEVKDENTEVTVELTAMKLKDKEVVVEAEVFEAGQSVFIVSADGERTALPVSVEGEPYVLEDGQILVVKEEGVIFSIGEAPAEEEETPAEDATGEVAQSDSATSSPVAKKIVEAVTREQHFSKEIVEAITENVNVMLSAVEEEVVTDSKDAEIEKLKAQVIELKKNEDEPAETPIVQGQAVTGVVDLSKTKGLSLMDTLNALPANK